MPRGLLLLALLVAVGCTPEPTRHHHEPAYETVYDTEIPVGDDDAAVLDGILSAPEIETFDLQLDDDAINALRGAPDVWVPATLTWRDLEFPGVGVRIKGNGSFRTIDQKPSLKIEFDKFNPGQDFFGLDTLVLNNMVTDPSNERERIAYTLYRAAGVPAARAAHSVLYINGEIRGLYTHMEDVDERMLALWFDNPNGPLFELFDVVLRPEDLWLFEHEGGPDDRTALIGAADALTLPRDEAIVAVEAHVDMDAFLTYYAVGGVIGQFDAWPFNDPTDDVHLYVDPTSRKIVPVPHGLDESLNDPFRNVSIPGASLLGQACYFTPDCKAALAEKTWAAYDLSVQIDLIGQAERGKRLLLDWGTHNQVPSETLQTIIDEHQLIEDFLIGREARLLENLGPR